MSSLRDRLAAVCDEALDGLGPGEGRAALGDVRAALDEPLRVVVAGRVNAGKSTLVNALIGARVAATAEGECTRLVAWYRYGADERVEVHRLDGTVTTLPLGPDRSVPADLGAPVEALSHLEVFLATPLLARATIIDTPGLMGLTAANAARTAGFVGFGAPAGLPGAGDAGEPQADEALDPASQQAVTQAEALVYLTKGPPPLDMKEHLERFRSVFSGSDVSVLNAVGVLTAIDVLGGDSTDPWPSAGPVVENYRARLSSVMMDFIPVVGLLAETAETGALTAADAAALVELAKLDGDERDDLFLDGLTSTEAPTGVSVEARTALLEKLRTYGVVAALAAVDQGASTTAELCAELYRCSGFARLRELVEGTFAERAEVIKAGVAVAKLTRAAYRFPELRPLLAALEELELDPAMHELEEVRAMQLVATGEARVAKRLEADLRRLTLGEGPRAKLGLPGEATDAEVAAAAAEQCGIWTAQENLALDGRSARVARMAKVSANHIWAAHRDAPHKGG